MTEVIQPDRTENRRKVHPGLNRTEDRHHEPQVDWILCGPAVLHTQKVTTQRNDPTTRVTQTRSTVCCLRRGSLTLDL